MTFPTPLRLRFLPIPFSSLFRPFFAPLKFFIGPVPVINDVLHNIRLVILDRIGHNEQC